MDISYNLNTVFNGDCLEVMKYLPDKSVDMILCDPPYGQTDAEWDKEIDLSSLWIQFKRIMKENTPIIFYTTTKFGNKLINSNPKWFRYDLVMPKSYNVGFFNCNKQPLRGHEIIYVFSKKSSLYNPQFIEGTPYKMNRTGDGYRLNDNVYSKNTNMPIDNNGYRYPSSILPIFKKTKLKHSHPTMKPIATNEWLIKTYSNQGDIILDCFVGSGSSLIACINTDRNYIGIEKDESIYNNCNENIKNHKK
jgi:site-specific DNA-methyltransferase (adenine-specific)